MSSRPSPFTSAYLVGSVSSIPPDGSNGCSEMTATVLNVAVHDLAALIVTEPSLQSAFPLYPTNAEPAFGVAVRLTIVPALNDAVHVIPQLIPAGLEAIVPVPRPAFPTVNV